MAGYFLATILGWVAGIFINYVADVMPVQRRLGPPNCKHCSAPIPWMNYILWPGKCLHCGNNRSARSWIVEITTILFTIWVWSDPSSVLGFAGEYVIFIYFAIIVIIDIEHRLILHPISLVGAGVGFAFGVYLHGWLSTILGCLMGFGIMLGFYYLGILFVRIIRRRNAEEIDPEALGFGDVILGGVLGLLLGWPNIILALLLAFILGGVFSLLYLAATVIFGRFRSFAVMPYGPFLIAGAAALLFFKDFFLSLVSP